MQRNLALLAATLPIGACMTVGQGDDARRINPTEEQVLAYVIEHWEEYYERRVRHSRELRGGQFTLQGIELVECADGYFALGCTFEAVVATEAGAEVRARFGGDFALHENGVTEVIIVG